MSVLHVRVRVRVRVRVGRGTCLVGRGAWAWGADCGLHVPAPVRVHGRAAGQVEAGGFRDRP
jgi:hypothetical protein